MLVLSRNIDKQNDRRRRLHASASCLKTTDLIHASEHSKSCKAAKASFSRAVSFSILTAVDAFLCMFLLRGRKGVGAGESKMTSTISGISPSYSSPPQEYCARSKMISAHMMRGKSISATLRNGGSSLTIMRTVSTGSRCFRAWKQHGRTQSSRDAYLHALVTPELEHTEALPFAAAHAVDDWSFLRET